MRGYTKTALIFVSFALVIAFQNCGKVKFGNDPVVQQSVPISYPPPIPVGGGPSPTPVVLGFSCPAGYVIQSDPFAMFSSNVFQLSKIPAAATFDVDICPNGDSESSDCLASMDPSNFEFNSGANTITINVGALAMTDPKNSSGEYEIPVRIRYCVAE